MTSDKFVKLSSSEKKKVVKSAVHGANVDQRKLVERYKRTCGDSYSEAKQVSR